MTQVQQPRLQVVWADSKYHNHELNARLEKSNAIPRKLEIVRRPKDALGFVLPPKRWHVERTVSWLGRSRRLSRDYELLTESSEAMVFIASMHRMVRRLSPTPHQPLFKYRLTT
jgi:putative transposase